ncbi:unnamed protein product [Paramecium primaurelia]|uniref:Protein kinase domain-containing protein n=1 Tax=Paramecium primaurelia TaxID=5886 RepID=A0A8S1K1B9_PARPR|nr:unnamed protein product [Paramecium primaurelia]CAD8117738.1 unnamed protein product [Paramecium primaurelia]
MIKSQNNKTIILTQSILDDSSEFWIHRPQTMLQFQLQDELQVVNRNRLILKTLLLGGHYIKYGEEKFLDVRNMFLEMVYHPRTSSTGFRLSKNGEKLDVYGEVQNWVEVLKKYTIQSNLQQKYKIIKKIGEGSLFQVFKIKNKITGFQYAARIYDKVQLHSSNYLLELVKKQVALLRQVDHKNLIKLYEIFESSNHLYIIQELIEGGTLDSKISQTNFNQEQIVFIIKQTLNGLEELHKKGYIHGEVNLKSIAFKYQQDLNSLCLIHYSKVMLINVARNNNKKMISQRTSLKNDKTYISDLQQLGIILIKLLTGYQFHQYNLPNSMDEIKSILNFKQINYELEVLLQQLLLTDFETQISETNTPLEVLKNDIFKKQLEPKNFILKYQAIDDKNQRVSINNLDEDSLDIRSRVHTLPYIENRQSNSRSLSNRKPNVTPLKLSTLHKLETIVKPPSQTSERRQSNLYQLPRMNILPKMKQKIQ